MRIPEIQAELVAIANRLAALSNELSRRKSAKPRRKVSRKMTPEVRQQIRVLKLERPHLTQMEIAGIVGVNSGRVSETLRGFRK